MSSQSPGFKNLSTLVQPATSSFPMRLFVQKRDPRTPFHASPDYREFQQGDFWLNISATPDPKLWFLAKKLSGGGDWILLGGGVGNVEEFEVDAFTAPGTNPVVPDSGGLVTITGGQVAAGTTANVIRTDSLAANTYTIEVQRSQAVASSTIGDNGVCHFDSGAFSVDANGFVQLKGGSEAIDSVGVDASTPPGTNPVLPNVSGEIFVTGGQVAAGTTANVIQTNSLAVNTYTVQVQRSQAVASSTVGDNGVSHFNSSQFTVDSNGFVQLVGGGPYISISPFIVGTDIHSGYSTIAAGIAAAVAAGATNSTPMNVYIKPKADGTPYTEDLTLQPGVNLIGFGETVTIIGKNTFSQIGSVTIEGLTLQTNSDFFLVVSGSVASAINIKASVLNCSNNSGISFTSSSSSSAILLNRCSANLGTTGINLFNKTSPGDLAILASGCGNSGGSITPSTTSAGIVNIEFCDFIHNISASGTAAIGILNSNLDNGNINQIALTTSGTATATIRHSYFASGTASCVSIGSGTSVSASHMIFNSANTNVLTGAGSLSYALLSFTGGSSGVNVTTVVSIPTLL